MITLALAISAFEPLLWSKRAMVTIVMGTRIPVEGADLVRPVCLDERIRVQVLLALTSGRTCADARAEQDAAARQLGLSGAEIDAARGGNCFDVKAAAAVRLACALRVSKPDAVWQAQKTAVAAGLRPEDLTMIESLAAAARAMDGGDGT